jgi:aminopeptidase
MDPRMNAMADVLVNYSVEAKPGDWIVIQSPTLGEPLAVACFQAALRAGAHPTTMFGSDDAQRIMLAQGDDDQLAFIPPSFLAMIERADCAINIMAPRNTRNLSNIDPARMAQQQKALEPIMEIFLKRSASGGLRWTIAAFPTESAAQDADMSLDEYEDFVYSSGLLSEADPVTAWKAMGARQNELIDFLKDKESIHIKGPGTDLTVGVAGRTWLNDDGHKNFPGGEIFTGPMEDSAEGTIQFNYPSNLNGREVSGIRLRFEAGKVVEASATVDEPFLQQMLDMDDGARRLGEFAFGMNQGILHPTKNILFDEKIGGTIHMALGRSYPETGGTNISALHWDIVFNLREGSDVTVDGQPFSHNGVFLL